MLFYIISTFVLHFLKTGGAISQAKGAFSNWWSNLLVSPDPVQKGVDVINEGEEIDNNHLDNSNNAADVANDRLDECENGLDAGNMEVPPQSGQVHMV